MSQLEEDMALQLDAAKIPYERQYRAIPARRFTWDFYFCLLYTSDAADE